MKIRQIVVGILLITGFLCLVVVIAMPLIAQLHFDSAERLIAGYLWKDAETQLVEAMKMDPYDSRYPAKLGEFLFTQAGYKGNQTPLLKKSEGYYERAVALNPRCAEYFVKMGEIDVSLFLEDPANKESLKSAFDDFKRAIADDPNGFSTAYAVGYSGLAAWKYLSEKEKAIVIDRLKYSLKQCPWYYEYIYPRVIEETGSTAILGSVK